jgi:CHAT domain-containing protein
VGLLSLLPLQAAGDPGSPGDQYTEWRHAGNYSAIRYAPNARSLGRCRSTARDAAFPDQSLLAIDAAVAAGGDPALRLRHVARETQEVSRHWTGPASPPVHDCTWTQFRRMAEGHTVWHLACHASADPNSIMDSRLSFADRDVTLDELRRTLRPGRRRLAVLSACQTNLTGAAMPNEMVGLPSALIQLGFAGVIASAWKVDDLATTYLMTAFYRQWRREGEEPAIALNHAQQWLRAATRVELAAQLPGVVPEGDITSQHPYADPRYWAAFAYTGV